MAQKMTHPESDLEVEARADQVEMYASQGWEPKAKPEKHSDK